MSPAQKRDEPRYWTVDDANAALPRIATLVERVREAAADLRVRAETIQSRARTNGHAPARTAADDLRSALAELARDGILLRDPEQGLVDFPALAPSGKVYWLCWLVGEPEVAWWHWPEDGFAGRTAITKLPS